MSRDTPASIPLPIHRVTSGDVTLAYRRFGRVGAAPILIAHGANYYDSADWIDVAAALATDREVITYDARGYGQSSWSASRDYSVAAQLDDITAVLHDARWPRTVLVGHSRGGSFTLRYAYAHPDDVAALVLVDFSPGHTPGTSSVEPIHVGRWGPVYADLTTAHRATSRDPAELDAERGRARAEEIFARRDGGWVNIVRDPSFANPGPDHSPHRDLTARFDGWAALSAVSARIPVLVVRGTRSRVYDDAALARIRHEFPTIKVVDVDSGHDVAGAAAPELIFAIGGFLR
ncbi:MAG: alpha/beta hydrolase [Gordonia sp. (in: high G+C Gram-positive bacteria)]